MAENIFIGGIHLVLNGISGNVGDTNSVASVVVPVNVPDLATAFKVNAGAVAAALGISGLICTSRPFKEMKHGGYEVAFHFEGFNFEVEGTQAEEAATYSFDTDMAEEPIQSHPAFSFFKKMYEWTGSDEDGAFPKELSGKGASGTTATSRNEEEKRPNPLFKVESWLRVGGVFTRSYAVSKVPPEVYSNIGMLVDYPPGAEKLNIPRFRRRCWLKMSPQISTGGRGSGSATRVTDRYRLTGPTNGSEAVVYDHSQMEE